MACRGKDISFTHELIASTFMLNPFQLYLVSQFAKSTNINDCYPITIHGDDAEIEDGCGADQDVERVPHVAINRKLESENV